MTCCEQAWTWLWWCFHSMFICFLSVFLSQNHLENPISQDCCIPPLRTFAYLRPSSGRLAQWHQSRWHASGPAHSGKGNKSIPRWRNAEVCMVIFPKPSKTASIEPSRDFLWAAREGAFLWANFGVGMMPTSLWRSWSSSFPMGVSWEPREMSCSSLLLYDSSSLSSDPSEAKRLSWRWVILVKNRA